MTKPTTEELKDLLGNVTQGEWAAANEFRSDLCGGTMHIWIGPSDWRSRVARVVEYAGDERANRSNATLIAMAPTLAAEVVRLREVLDRIDAVVDECEYDKKTRHTIDRLRQALSQK